jgi:hypothetical protein
MSNMSLNINLADFTAIKITCTQCHASAEFPVARLQGDAPERCFYCRAEWFVAKSPQATAFEHLCRALGELRGDAVSGCRVQLVMPQVFRLHADLSAHLVFGISGTTRQTEAQH